MTGFGTALVAVPVLTWLWGPAEAIFAVASLDVLGSAVLLPGCRRYVLPGLVAVMLVGAVAGQWVGTELLAVLPESTVQIILGVAVGAFALDMVWRPVKRGRGELVRLPRPPWAALGLGGAAGFGGGVMGGLTGAGGPPVVLFLRRYFLPHVFRAQCIAVFAIGSLTLSAMLLLKGEVEPSALARTAWLAVPMVVGSLVGTALSGRLPRDVFGRTVGGVLVGSAVAMVVTGLV